MSFCILRKFLILFQETENLKIFLYFRKLLSAWKIKRTYSEKFSYILGNGTLQPLFYTLDKTPLGETGCLSSLYYLLAAQALSFSMNFFVTYGTPCRAWGHYFHLIFCHLGDTMQHQGSLLSSLTTLVAYRIPCRARGHRSHFMPNPYLGGQRIFLRVASIQKIYLCPHPWLPCDQFNQ